MQIHELTRKSRVNEDVAANLPMMISQAAQNMQRQWSRQVSQALAADAVTDTEKLSTQSKTALKKALNSIVSRNQFLGGLDFTNLSQMVSQTDDNGAYTPVYINQADGIMNRLYAGIRQLGNLDAEKVDTQELAEFRTIAQAAYEAGVLMQTHPKQQAGTTS
jgi:hypothetical protein